MANQFREVEETFSRLKQKFGERKISKREFIDSLKQLRIKDDQGRFWMIGAQTGKWYFFDGEDWAQAQPPSFEDRKVVCIYCGFENDLEAEGCVRCGSRETAAREIEEPPPPAPARMEEEPGTETAAGFIVRSVEAPSFLRFFGALGLFAGMVLGLLLGVTSLFPGFVAVLPGFFRDMQGTLLGGIVFTILGGIFGFVLGAGGGYLEAVAVNGILSLTGGIRIGTDRLGKKD